MKYTEIEKKEAVELSTENHTIASALKSLTLTTKYPALQNKIYNSTSSREIVIQNELDFITDLRNGNFELIKIIEYLVVGRDKEGDDYVIYPTEYGTIQSHYTENFSVFDYGFSKKTAETLASAIRGKIEPI